MLAHLVLLAVAAATPRPVPETLSFADSKSVQITLDEPGMVYLVDFWALGCSPCMREMPELEKLAKEYEPSGRFKLVSVLWGGFNGAKLDDTSKNLNTSLAFYSDPEKWLERYWSPSFPTKVLIKDGVILHEAKGGGEGAYGKWSRLVAKALKTP